VTVTNHFLAPNSHMDAPWRRLCTQLGLAGINISPPPVRNGYGPTVVPPPWPTLRFGLLGLYNLRRHLDVLKSKPNVFLTYQSRFFASDVAWFAGGASTDGRHIPDSGFFPEFDDVRETLPTGPVGSDARKSLNQRIQHMVFDLVHGPPYIPFFANIVSRLLSGIAPSADPPLFSTSRAPPFPIPLSYRNTFAAPPTSRRLSSLITPQSRTYRPNRTNIYRIRWRPDRQQMVQQRACPWLVPHSVRPQCPPHPAPATLIPAPDSADSSHYKFFGRPLGALNEVFGAHPVVIPDDDDEDL
jgi:hypothetical protein